MARPSPAVLRFGDGWRVGAGVAGYALGVNILAYALTRKEIMI